MPDINLTDEEYYSYYIHEDDDVVDISFQDTNPIKDDDERILGKRVVIMED